MKTPKLNWRGIFAISACLLLACTSAQAAIISMVNANAAGEDWGNPPGDWEGGQSPVVAPLNDFLVGSTFLVRSPNNAPTSVFPGLSLQLEVGSIFRLKPTDGGTIEIGNLRLNGGTLHNGNNGTSGNAFDMTVFGGITVLAPSSIDVGEMTGNAFNQSGTNDEFRRLVINATLAGSGLLSIGDDPADGDASDVTVANFSSRLGASAVEITSGLNSFSGGWNVAGGVLRGVTPGSLGFGSITVGAATGFELDYDLFLPTDALILNGVTSLDTNWTFASATIAGVPLSPGTYTTAELATQFPNHVVAGATGSLTVVPEPGSALLAGVGALAFAVRRRRRLS
jgi:hypothetical protein